jgi:hypothetical protein
MEFIYMTPGQGGGSNSGGGQGGSNSGGGGNSGGGQGGSNNQGGSSNRGFASMPEEKVREIARKGGKAAHVPGNEQQWVG